MDFKILIQNQFNFLQYQIVYYHAADKASENGWHVRNSANCRSFVFPLFQPNCIFIFFFRWKYHFHPFADAHSRKAFAKDSRQLTIMRFWNVGNLHFLWIGFSPCSHRTYHRQTKLYWMKNQETLGGKCIDGINHIIKGLTF